ncbi:MAG: bis(5'-nucleosyl)-tetraphosphatase (symmetrical) YqeK [Lachnospiraceae bacterium]|nr:bis(5'-nucleosyl)-tetraphosphatase (symmetrical) YqeK [Lachnospiraceae bacterium]
MQKEKWDKQVKDLTRCMEKELDEKRFRHTMSVAQTAACMAMRYDVDPYKAYVAGLLHDCAKCIKNKKKLELAEMYDIPVSAPAKENPDLLHAPLGSVLAKERYGITDPEILSAIMYHTTGKPNMTKLEMILYIADYIEIHRKMLPLLERARSLAFVSLEECMCVILESTLSYLGKNGAMLDPMTKETLTYYNNLN